MTWNSTLKSFSISLALAASIAFAQATANYVYHEQTGNDVTGGNPNTCGGAQAYVPVANPTSAQTYLLRFKVEYQFYTDTLKVYYTTNGSAPSGALGVGSGTTTVVSGNYQCTFTSGPNTVDVCNATIPAQPAGTVVKYIVSARHSGGGLEIFANSGEFNNPFSTSAQATVFQYTVGSTTDLYWDSNGATAGAGTAPAGTWGTSTFWSTVFDGTAATGAWTSGRNAVFSAGTDATGTFTVTGSGTLTANSLKFEEGTVTVTAGTLNLTGTALYDVGTTVATVGSIVTGTAGYAKAGTGRLVLSSGASTITGPVTVTNGILEITASGNIGGTGAGAGNITLDGGTFRNSAVGSGITFLTGNRGFIIGANGGTIDVPGSLANVQIYTSGSITGVGNTLTKSGPGVFRNTTPTSVTFTKLLVTGGLYQAAADASYGAVPGSFLADAITLNGGGLGLSAGVSFAANRGITIGASGGTFDGISSATVAGKITGSATITKTGAGIYTLSADNSATFTGPILVSGGAILVGNNNGLGDSVGATTVSSGAAVYISGTRTVPEPLTLNGTGTNATTSGALRSQANVNIWTGSITLGSSGVRINCDSSTLVLSGGVSGSGNPSLSIGGAGSVTISNTPVNIGAGTLTWDGATQLRLDTANTMGAFNYNTAIVKFNHNNAAGSGTITVNTPAGTGEFSVTGGFFVTMPNAVVLSAGVNPIMYAASGASLEMTGPISGPGALRRNDTGAVGPVFSGNNTYSGGYTINSRDVTFGNRLALGVGTFTIGDPTLAMANLITLKTKPGTGLTGVNAVTNSITINTNFAIVGPDPIQFSGNVALASATTVTVSNSTQATFSGNITGPGIGINKTGASTLTLGGSNSYSGSTVVLAGTLLVNGSINNSPALVQTGATLGGNGSVGALSVNVGGTLAPGTSIGTLTAATVSTLAGTNLMEIDRTGPAICDKLIVTNSAIPLGGVLTVKLLGGTLQLGDTFQLFDGTLTGSFTTLNLPVPPAGMVWDTSQLTAGGLGTITLVCSGTLAASAGPDKAICGIGSVAIGGSPTASGGSGAGYTYLWSPSTGLSSDTAPNPLASPAITTVYTVTVTDLLGCTAVSAPVTVTVNPTPTISASNPSATGCQGANASLIYGTTTGSPDQYTIDFDAAAEAAGFTDVAFTALPASPIPVNIPFAVGAGTYNATLLVRDSTTGCVSPGSPFTVTVIASPTITLVANPSVCAGVTNADVNYSATSESPDQYSLDFDATAEADGFVDVLLAPLTNSPIVISLPPAAPAGVYLAILTVRNSSTGCTSSNIPIALTNLAPVIACPSDLVVSNSPGLCENTNVAIGLATPVNCVPLILTNNAPVTFPRGITPVIWTAVASNGISASCTQLVTVVDAEAPFINCGQHETVSCMQGWGFTVPIVTDNCDNGLIPVAISTTTNFQCGYTFEATRVWQVTDTSANVTYCTQVVTYVDFIPPTITQCAPDSTVCGSDIPAPDTSLVIATNQFDPCDTSIPLITYVGDVTNGSNPMIISRTYRAADACGNSVQCVQTITVFTTKPTITLGANPSVCAGVTNTELTYSATSEFPDQYTIDFDTTAESQGFVDVVLAPLTNSPIVISLPPTLPAGVYQAIFTVRNSTNGCSSTNIPIAITNIAPLVACPADLIVSNSPGLCENTNVALGTPVVCSPIILTNDAPASFPRGNTPVIWTAVASNGITATCTQLVTVVDAEAPFVNCGQHETVSCMQGWGFTVPIVTDNCDNGLVPVAISTTTNFSCGYTFEATRSWQVTDLSSNVTYCTQVVTLVDFIPPNITQCAPDTTVCVYDIPPPDVSLITATNDFDPCDTSIPLITYVGAVTNGSNPMIISRTYRAADACGNSVQCVQTITVNPQPTITLGLNPSVCAGITNAELTYSGTSESPDQYSIDFDTNAETNGFVDVLLAPLTASPIVISLPTAAPAGVYQAILTVRNSTTGCSSTNIPIALTNIAPLITCPGNRVVSTSPGLCVATNVSIGEPFLGGCLPTVLSNDAPAIFPHGTTTVTWSAVASNGITSTCTELVTVIDDEPPFINCGQHETVSCNQGWGFTVPIVTDNCDSGLIPVAISTTTNFTCGYTFEATRIWQVTDLSSNVTYCTQVVTLVDFIPPTITQCASNLTVNCLADVPAPDISLITADNQFDPCDTSIPLITYVGEVTNGSNPTIISRTYRAADACGNYVECIQTITIPAPVLALSCSTNKTVECGSTWDFDEPVGSGICCGTNITVTILGTLTNGTCPQLITRTWQATCYTNSTNCSQTVTVVDTTPPALACATNKTVECGSIWSFDAPGGTDSCSGTNVLVSVLGTITNGACPEVITRTWLATDLCGNTNTCSQAVTVEDTTPPAFTCATNKTVECGSAWDFDVPAATDACSGTNVIVSVLGTITNGSCPEFITRTWSATDACGNSNTCSQVVTVIDTTPPSINCGANETLALGLGWDFTVPIVSDCSPPVSVVAQSTTTNPLCGGSFIATRVWLATDACSNSVTCTQVVTVVDFTPPQITCSPDKTVQCGSAWDFDFPSALDDGCGTNVTITVLNTQTNGSGCSYTVTRTWQATDCCTNSSTCSQIVAVVDTTAPSLVCTTNKTVECGSLWSFDSPAASDSCSGTNVVVNVLGTVTNGSCPELITQTWSATDACGNSNTCSQTVTVVDTTPPSLTCATNKTVISGSLWSFDPPSASDACSGTNVVVNVSGTATNGTACAQLLTRTWLATDACGNTNGCSQTVTVVPPPLVLTCATNKTIPCGSCSLAAGPLDFSLVHTLAGDGSEGQYPYASLIQDTNGALYGTASAWAGGGLGTVFRVNPDGTGFTVLHSLAASGLEGATPVSSLLLASDGMLYGTASAGGSNSVGTIFKLATDGTGFSVLHHFGAGATDGRKPLAGLLEGSDTALYGTTESGGTSNLGTVFILSKDGSGYSIIHHFGTSAGDGQNPYAALVEVSNNSYYGTTSAGGVSNAGTVFTLHGNGSGYTVVHSFAGGVGGSLPYAPLLEGSDGALYGTAYSGGANNGGLIYKLTTSGTGFLVLHDFLASATDGLSPFAGLIESADGDLFGTTAGGGALFHGTAYSIGKTGLAYNVLHDFASPDGIMPAGGLLLASDGALYGAASAAGAGSGTVYKLACAGALSFNPPTASGGASNVVITITSTVTNGDCPKMITRTWQATDLCSSTATCSQTITIIDTIPPVITCPSNIVIFTCTNLIVPYTVGVTDNCTTNVNLVCTPPSGTMFNLGTTNTIHCVATDACGNTNSCDFTIALPRPALLGNLQIGLNGTTVTISWSSPGILQQSDTLFGPWTDVAGTPASPYSFTVSLSSPMRYYRLRCN